MIITVPTYQRYGRIHHFLEFPTDILNAMLFVVREHELEQYRRFHPSYRFITVPDIGGIGDTRDYIVGKFPNDKVVMLDDDLEFATRRTDDPTKFRASSKEDIRAMFADIRENLNFTAHGGVSHREGANRNCDLCLYNGRVMRVLAYNTDILVREGIKFGPATFMCDFHVTLALLTRGYMNCISNEWVHNQKGSNNQPGGCTSQRTPERQREAAEWLAAMYPDFVTVVKKQTKTSWNGQERYDVRIQWKRAYESGEGKGGKAGLLDAGTRNNQGVERGWSPQALE